MTQWLARGRTARRDAVGMAETYAKQGYCLRIEAFESRIALTVNFSVDFLLQTGTPLEQTDSRYEFLSADWNRDGTPDLAVVKKSGTSTGRTELHVLDGAKRFQSFLIQVGTALGVTDDRFEFQVADWNKDGRQDLVAIQKRDTGTKTTEVHILNGASNYQSYLLNTRTALAPAGSQFKFLMSDWNRDGKPDLVAVAKQFTGTQTTELHVLSGASNFGTFLLQTGTALGPTDERFEFQMLDWNKDGKQDLVAIKKSGTGTSRTEVHILSGAAGYKTFLRNTGTALGETGQSFSFLIADWNKDSHADLIAIKKSQTGTKSTEVHVVTGASGFIPWFDVNIKDAGLRSLIYRDYADNTINRTEMLGFFTQVGRDGSVSEPEIHDLRVIQSSFNMPTYVKVLSRNVVEGSKANATFQKTALGNLTPGSPSARLDKLVAKWFRGQDVPDAPGYSYGTVAGNLFVGGVEMKDVEQGQIGDCYFLAPLAAIAKTSPSAITSAFIDNGDGTWSVRFYANGNEDYVTVNRWLPKDSFSRLVFANSGDLISDTRNELWVPLFEKAFAQWNETGHAFGRDGKNSYGISSDDNNGINSGDNGDSYVYLSGRHPTEPIVTQDFSRARLITALAEGRAVTVGSRAQPPASTSVVGSHAYVVTGYNKASKLFSFYNPWGFRHPGPLSWTQMRSAFAGIQISNSNGATAPDGGLSLRSTRKSLPRDLASIEQVLAPACVEFDPATPVKRWSVVPRQSTPISDSGRS